MEEVVEEVVEEVGGKGEWRRRKTGVALEWL